MCSIASIGKGDENAGRPLFSPVLVGPRARVLLMKGGGIYADGLQLKILTSEILSAVYSTTVVVEATASGNRVCLPPL